MDITTHEIRSDTWKTIIQNCQSRPAGTTVKQWLDENGISEKSYYYWLIITGRRSRLSGGGGATCPVQTEPPRVLLSQ